MCYSNKFKCELGWFVPVMPSFPLPSAAFALRSASLHSAATTISMAALLTVSTRHKERLACVTTLSGSARWGWLAHLSWPMLPRPACFLISPVRLLFPRLPPRPTFLTLSLSAVWAYVHRNQPAASASPSAPCRSGAARSAGARRSRAARSPASLQTTVCHRMRHASASADLAGFLRPPFRLLCSQPTLISPSTQPSSARRRASSTERVALRTPSSQATCAGAHATLAPAAPHLASSSRSACASASAGGAQTLTAAGAGVICALSAHTGGPGMPSPKLGAGRDAPCKGQLSTCVGGSSAWPAGGLRPVPGHVPVGVLEHSRELHGHLPNQRRRSAIARCLPGAVHLFFPVCSLACQTKGTTDAAARCQANCHETRYKCDDGCQRSRDTCSTACERCAHAPSFAALRGKGFLRVIFCASSTVPLAVKHAPARGDAMPISIRT